MILCSKRVYLNVLTQLWDRDTLLNANYYILDQNNTGLGGVSTRISYDGNGNLVQENNDSISSKYNIKSIRGNVLDPTVYRTTLLTSEGESPEQAICNYVIKELDKDGNKYLIWDTLFSSELKGNKIQIGIYLDDETLIDFGNLICQYLSHNFGCDVIFLDAMCRKNVFGQPFYPGNKQNGLRMSDYLRDYKLLNDFQTNLTTSLSAAGSHNLSVWMARLDWDTLVRIYNLLFPNEPLKPGEYTPEMLKQIIIGKSMEGAPTVDRNSAIGNLIYSTSNLFQDVLDSYDDEIDIESFANDNDYMY